MMMQYNIVEFFSYVFEIERDMKFYVCNILHFLLLLSSKISDSLDMRILS